AGPIDQRRRQLRKASDSEGFHVNSRVTRIQANRAADSEVIGPRLLKNELLIDEDHHAVPGDHPAKGVPGVRHQGPDQGNPDTPPIQSVCPIGAMDSKLCWVQLPVEDDSGTTERVQTDILRLRPSDGLDLDGT